jgi:hypothetical protein
MPPARTIQMTQLRPIRAAVRLFDGAVLVLLIACLMAEFAPAQTAMEVANRRRALLTQNSAAPTGNNPNSSYLGAISASVDATVDRQVNANRQTTLDDPGLTPLRIIAPNVNGEDDAFTEIQAVTPTLLNGGRTKHYGFTTVPLSTSTWNPGSMGRTQNAPVSRGQFPLLSSSRDRQSIHGSETLGSTDITLSRPTLNSTTPENLGRTRVHRSNLTGLRKTRRQQEIYLRNCSELYLSELQCRMKVRQQRVSANRHDPTQSYRKSLEAIR